jgi:hypothetical protein
MLYFAKAFHFKNSKVLKGIVFAKNKKEKTALREREVVRNKIALASPTQ